MTPGLVSAKKSRQSAGMIRAAGVAVVMIGGL
jgi:hypothetical protein